MRNSLACQDILYEFAPTTFKLGAYATCMCTCKPCYLPCVAFIVGCLLVGVFSCRVSTIVKYYFMYNCYGLIGQTDNHILRSGLHEKY